MPELLPEVLAERGGFAPMRDVEGGEGEHFATGLAGAEGKVGVFSGGEGFVKGGHNVQQGAVEQHVARGNQAEGFRGDGFVGVGLGGWIFQVPMCVPGALNPVAGFGRAHGVAEHDGGGFQQPRGGVHEPIAGGDAVAIEEREGVAASHAQGLIAAYGDGCAGQDGAFVEPRLARHVHGVICAAAVHENGFQPPAGRPLQAIQRGFQIREVGGFVERHHHHG